MSATATAPRRAGRTAERRQLAEVAHLAARLGLDPERGPRRRWGVGLAEVTEAEADELLAALRARLAAQPPAPAAEPVTVSGPALVASLRPAQREALVAAGLLAGEVFLGPPPGVVLAWPLGARDADGRPMPYLRDGGLVVPNGAAPSWCWWRGGLAPDEVVARLVAAGGPRPTASASGALVAL